MPRVRRSRRQAPALELLDATLLELRRGLTASAARTVAYELFVASSRLRGQAIIRLAIGNAQTTEGDIRRSWEVLRACAGRQ